MGVDQAEPTTEGEDLLPEADDVDGLAEDLARATLAALWFIRSGMRPPSIEHQRAVMLAGEEDAPELPELRAGDAPELRPHRLTASPSPPSPSGCA